ncbi:helix-turn-helix domain-containing protein, partial [Streptomyces californicus]|uniref:helix-turn-helix domain-containing protein n=1 Tax=Streptomyces californicus TaxID=67351 RepID=UPI00200CECEB
MDTQQNTALTRALAEIPGPLPTRGVVHITLPHTDRFTVVGNHLAQHPELSLAAIGLAVRIQSLPRGTDISVKTLAAQCREGERLIASRLRELEACGYLQRARERRPDGRITTRTLYCNHPAALTAHHAQTRPGTLPRHRSIPHQRSAPHDRQVPHHRSAPAPHHRSGPAPLDRSIPAADPEHHAVAAPSPSPSPAPAPAPAPAERSAPAQEAARQAVPEADRTEAPEPAPPREPTREAAPAPAREAAPEPAAVPAQGPAPTPVPAENPAPESAQTPAPAQPPT